MNMSNFLDNVALNYEKIISLFKSRSASTGLSFDYDILADTILKCNDTVPNISDCTAYLWTAYKHNMIQHAQHTNEVNIDDTNVDVMDDDECVDFNDVEQLIVDKFGDELYQLFVKHCNGETYGKLSKEDKKLKYKFRRIREFVRLNYYH